MDNLKITRALKTNSGYRMIRAPKRTLIRFFTLLVFTGLFLFRILSPWKNLPGL
jgi:hypothetical protein